MSIALSPMVIDDVPVRFSLYRDPSKDPDPAMLPLNIFTIDVFVYGQSVVFQTRTTDLITIDDAAMECVELMDEIRALGETPVKAQILGTFTDDGRWRWSGRPLTPGTIAFNAWRKAQWAQDARVAA